MTWLLALCLALQPLIAGPRIAVSKSPSHTIIVDQIPTGAIGACVIFQSEDETIDGLPWAPRHCYYWDESITGFQDDWAFITTGHNYEMWAVIQTQLADGSDGPDFETNHLHEAH